MRLGRSVAALRHRATVRSVEGIASRPRLSRTFVTPLPSGDSARLRTIEASSSGQITLTAPVGAIGMPFTECGAFQLAYIDNVAACLAPSPGAPPAPDAAARTRSGENPGLEGDGSEIDWHSVVAGV